MNNHKNIVFLDRSAESMDILMKDIRRYKVLTDEEEKTLLQRMSQGDKKARKQLINSNLRFVLSRAKQYAWTGVSQLDLFQAGAMGLTLAVDKFDVTKGNGLLAFAVHYINGELLKAVNEHQKGACIVSLEAPISAEKSCTQTFEDVLNSGRESGADWDVRYEQAFKVMVAQVERDFFSEAARLWEDYVVMKELDCDIADVARKHNISTNCAESLIRRINHSLAARFIPNRAA
jgi:RNA polymerase sigma factor (sigma-70 family)